ncbi:MAG: type II toxin-antitoxin system RelE/ParE family toxin [Nitrospirota bacterium]
MWADDFIGNLPDEERAEVDAVLEDLAVHGLDAPLVSLRQVRGKLWEIRFTRARIFYTMAEEGTMVLLHAYKKQSRKAPPHEIDTALKRMRQLAE